LRFSLLSLSNIIAERDYEQVGTPLDPGSDKNVLPSSVLHSFAPLCFTLSPLCASLFRPSVLQSFAPLCFTLSPLCASLFAPLCFTLSPLCASLFRPSVLHSFAPLCFTLLPLCASLFRPLCAAPWRARAWRRWACSWTRRPRVYRRRRRAGYTADITSACLAGSFSLNLSCPALGAASWKQQSSAQRGGGQVLPLLAGRGQQCAARKDFIPFKEGATE